MRCPKRCRWLAAEGAAGRNGFLHLFQELPATLFRPGLKVAEKGFRRLNAPDLLAAVAEGAVYMNGVWVKKGRKQVPA
jgi:hypothetical protein